MAIFHLDAKPIGRSAGRSATAAAAYRAGIKIFDLRSGLEHDYTRKGGVLDKELILPGGGTANRAEFWNRVEMHHKRGDAVLVRDIEVALPTELSARQRRDLAVDFAREMADRYGVAADVALHAPRTITERDLARDPDQYHEIDPETGRRHNGNWHAHIMLSACHVQPDGTLGKKAVALDPIHCQREKIENMVEHYRPVWADRCNAALAKYGHHSRVDHRTLAAQGIDREPTKHKGPAVQEIEIRGGSFVAQRIEAERLAGEALRAEVRAVALAQVMEHVRQLEEKKDERIRSATFDRIGANLAAASTDGRSTVGAIKAAQGHRLASREHLIAATGLANHSERDPDRVAKATREYRRARYAGAIARSVIRELGGIVPKITRAATRIVAAQMRPMALLRQWREGMASSVPKTVGEAAMGLSGALPSMPAPGRSMAHRVQESFQAMARWIAERGELRAIDTAKVECCGPVLNRDDVHLVQRVAPGAYVIHRQRDLDQLPVLNQSATHISYRAGRGAVRGPVVGQEQEQEPPSPRGPRM